jgi:enamine deaminase RidA (YjgF/YER057c/UK114 family)
MPKKLVLTGLGRNPNAVSGAVVSRGILYTAVIPRRLDGSVETGDPAVQIGLTLENLKRTVEAAGGSLDDYVQIVVYLSDPKHFDLMISIYKKYFTREPYPNRATIFAAGLAVPGMIVEMVAQAHLPRHAPEDDGEGPAGQEQE